jgi:hypothetical protein
MAKSHKAKVKKFCAFVQVPRYGAYDEVVGWKRHNKGCFRSEKKANDVADKLARQWGHDTELHIGVAGPGYDPYTGIKRRKPMPARRKAQAINRARRPSNDIPF